MYTRLSQAVVVVLCLLSILSAQHFVQPSPLPGQRIAQALETEWVRSGPAAVRLVLGQSGVDGAKAVPLGIEIKLRQGWWTYWRAPGESGMPPSFDWTGSRNLRWAPELSWPAPERHDLFGHSLRVYRDHLVFPLQVTPLKSGQDIDLQLKFRFATCRMVCVPAFAALSLRVPALPADQPNAASRHLRTINSFAATVPTNNQDLSGFRVDKVTVSQGGTTPQLRVELETQYGLSKPLVLFETAPGDPPRQAMRIASQDGQKRWIFAASLEDGPSKLKHGLRGERVRITVFDGR
ncbi:MAG TPA: hypothetical protein DCL48_02190, partial [Alphaproteobacteria bacterium]|nr:hypothetical protein [Alphaproteobacteria bacterium]